MNRTLLGEERTARALEAAGVVLWEWDLDADRVEVAGAWAALLGADTEPAPEGRAWLARVHPDDGPGLRAAAAAHLAGMTPHLELDLRLRRADGTYAWVHARGALTTGADGRPATIAGGLYDVTGRQRAFAHLEYRANHDALTGLANRAHFFGLLERAIERANRAETPPCGVVFLDLDGFKAVNDRFGHHFGDRLLSEAGRRLQACVRPGDVVGRLGGDELAVLLGRVADAVEADQIAQRLAAALAEPYAIEGIEVRVTASAGVAVAGDGDHAAELVQLADAAMYRAKLTA